MDFRLIAESGRGRCMLWRGPEQLGAGDIALLRDFHLNVLALALFPEFLERSSQPAFTRPEAHDAQGVARSAPL